MLRNLRALIEKQSIDENEFKSDSRHAHYLANMPRLEIKQEVLTRKYFDETGMISHYQVLLPKQLLEEFLFSLHGQSARHPGITKMIQEARQKYYYPSLAKHIRQWVINCEDCIKNKRIDNSRLKTPLLNCPEWDLGPEDALQIDVLTQSPTKRRIRKCHHCNGCVLKVPVCLPGENCKCGDCCQSTDGYYVQTYILTDNVGVRQRINLHVTNNIRSSSSTWNTTETRDH